jgi:hypothetical protein
MNEMTFEQLDRAARENVLRFAADRGCLWRLCGRRACRRTRSCRGDPRVCTGRIADWMEAIEDERLERPNFAAIEAGLKTKEEEQAYRVWRKKLEACW